MSAESLARALVDEFARCGIREACLAPGSRSAPLALALFDESRIRLHVRLDERSASFLALGLAKASGRPAIVVSTSGTAAANFYPAIVEAHNARVPMIVLTADRPFELRGTGANQTIDQVKLFGDAVRWWAEIHTDDHATTERHWRSVASHASRLANGSMRGPVHVNVSLREPLIGTDRSPDEGTGRPGNRPWHTMVEDAPAARSEAVVEHLAARLSAVERGLIVAGDADLDPSPLSELARALRWPVIAEPLSGLRSSEMAITTYDSLLRLPRWRATHRPELVIRLGRIGTSKALLEWLDHSVEQILIDDDGEWPDPTRVIAESVRADPSSLAAQLRGHIHARADSDWALSWADAEQQARRVIDDILDTTDVPNEPRVARDMADLMAPKETLVVGSSMPVRDLDSFMRVRPGLRVLGNRGASGIDGFVSTALGAALASAGKTRALSGDLALLHDAGGLATLDSPRPDLDLVVLNNDGGGIFSFLPQSRRGDSFETLFGTPHGIELRLIAEAYGCGYSLLESARDLAPMLTGSYNGVRIIEVRTDRSRNVALHRRIWGAVEDEFAGAG